MRQRGTTCWKMASHLKELNTAVRSTDNRKNPSSATDVKSSATPPKNARTPMTPDESVEKNTEPHSVATRIGSAPTAREATPPPIQDAQPEKPPTPPNRPRP